MSTETSICGDTTDKETYVFAAQTAKGKISTDPGYYPWIGQRL
jgi:hypothetical protein